MEKKANLPAEETSATASVIVADVELQGWDQKATKRLLWRLDWHIIPFMSLIYLWVSVCGDGLALSNVYQALLP